MKIDVRPSTIIFRSPLLFPVFFVVPFLVILSVVLHVKLPFAGSPYPLLVSNACFSLLALIRAGYYFKRIFRPLRYDPSSGKPRNCSPTAQPASVIRDTLAKAGYRFDQHRNYAEKREAGFIGVFLAYAGIFLVLFTGTLDNLYQFSGTLRHGVGVPTDLQKRDAFRTLSVGPITADLSTLPKMRIVRQFFPSSTYPVGAAEVAFRFPDGREQQVILRGTEPFRAGSYDIYFRKMLYEPQLTITIDDATPVFKGRIVLEQLPERVDDFSFYGTFAEGAIEGKVFYQPEKSRLRVIVNQGVQQLLDAVLVFQTDQLSRSANFAIMCERMGVWSEIYVVHRRHMSAMYFGGFIALIGLLLRVAVRPQRVWLDEAHDECLACWVGKEPEKLLKHQPTTSDFS